jgi:hypothetical protein
MTSLPVPVNLLSDPAFAQSSALRVASTICKVSTPVAAPPTLEPSVNKPSVKTLETPLPKKGTLLRETPAIGIVTSKESLDAYSTDALRKFCKMHSATFVSKTHTKDQLKELAWSMCAARNDSNPQSEQKESGGSYEKQCHAVSNASPDSDDRVIVLRYP